MLNLPANPTAILFDLDGTVSDSGPVIMNTVRDVLENHGITPPPAKDLRRFVGPPLARGMVEIGGWPADDAAGGVAAYRALYRQRMFDAPLYPGIREVIVAAHQAGMKLAIATSKVENLAADLIEHYGLSHYFSAVCGAEPGDANSEKHLVVRKALDCLTRAGADVSAPVMVGDRFHDIEGAAHWAIPTIIVQWGYGSDDESTGASLSVKTPAELMKALNITG